eukprot:TRINITY_DN9856_c0_g1_i1.p3 TRINITY_DN9856_c0_g1~~TRINITY_DN9856_c0_g1_i1.p3  ORF type:complete len:165 (+),score=35.33 TRINITY_DN9856_c0_g1_i1:73-567(+)
MSTKSRKRLLKDLKLLQKEPQEGILAHPSSDSLMIWSAVIFGPPDTPFENGVFRLKLEFSEEYPARAPNVKFVTEVFHPNVYTNGNICLDILQKRWSPSFSVGAILTSIQSLLDEPNPNSPANNEAAKLFSENKVEYERRVHQCVETSWIDGGVHALKRSKSSE